MSANPIDNNSTPKTTGSLEDLFRHHLGEEAAVPPSPMLWDQIDTSLLIRQNEIYRRRLTATRWVAAASLLLATLAGTGWWVGHESALTRSELATTSQTGAASTGNAAATASNGQRNAGSTAILSSGSNGAGANEANGSNGSSVLDGTVGQSAASVAATATESAERSAAGHLQNRASRSATPATVARNVAPRYTGFQSASERGGQPQGLKVTHRNATRLVAATVATAKNPASATATAEPNSPTYATRDAQSAATQTPEATDFNSGNTNPAASRELAVGGVAAATGLVAGATTAPASAAGAGLATATPTVAAVAPAAAVAPEQVGLLSARSATLNMAPTALPNGLATLSLPAEAPLVGPDTHRWHYGVSYSASVFNPNINFSRAGIEPEHDYNLALGAESPALTEAAAVEYRENLRPGLSQRIALLASRHLGGHWSLRTGVEVSQSTAKSASSTSFVGEQIPYIGQSGSGPMQTTNFRYRIASIPVELQYSNPVKRGWSLYGRLGGVVSALLGVRSEVEGEPEATKTYSLISASTPYRRALLNVRGGAGAQFRTATGKWGFSVGPTAELGLVSMNAHPVQNYFAQSHAYSFGIETAVEFGR